MYLNGSNVTPRDSSFESAGSAATPPPGPRLTNEFASSDRLVLKDMKEGNGNFTNGNMHNGNAHQQLKHNSRDGSLLSNDALHLQKKNQSAFKSNDTASSSSFSGGHLVGQPKVLNHTATPEGPRDFLGGGNGHSRDPTKLDAYSRPLESSKIEKRKYVPIQRPLYSANDSSAAFPTTINVSANSIHSSAFVHPAHSSAVHNTRSGQCLVLYAQAAPAASSQHPYPSNLSIEEEESKKKKQKIRNQYYDPILYDEYFGGGAAGQAAQLPSLQPKYVPFVSSGTPKHYDLSITNSFEEIITEEDARQRIAGLLAYKNFSSEENKINNNTNIILSKNNNSGDYEYYEEYYEEELEEEEEDGTDDEEAPRIDIIEGKGNGKRAWNTIYGKSQGRSYLEEKENVYNNNNNNNRGVKKHHGTEMNTPGGGQLVPYRQNLQRELCDSANELNIPDLREEDNSKKEINKKEKEKVPGKKNSSPSSTVLEGHTEANRPQREEKNNDNKNDDTPISVTQNSSSKKKDGKKKGGDKSSHSENRHVHEPLARISPSNNSPFSADISIVPTEEEMVRNRVAPSYEESENGTEKKQKKKYHRKAASEDRLSMESDNDRHVKKEKKKHGGKHKKMPIDHEEEELSMKYQKLKQKEGKKSGRLEDGALKKHQSVTRPRKIKPLINCCGLAEESETYEADSQSSEKNSFMSIIRRFFTGDKQNTPSRSGSSEDETDSVEQENLERKRRALREHQKRKEKEKLLMSQEKDTNKKKLTHHRNSSQKRREAHPRRRTESQETPTEDSLY